MWHEMSLDVQLYVKTCATCSKNKKPRVKPRGELGSYHAGKRMERVHLDMMGPFPEPRSGNKYILVMVDQFTKWVEVQPLPEISAETTARAAVDGFFSRFGYPEQIHTDQGKNFDGNLFRELCKMLRITKTRTTPYRPSSNGQVECYNRLLLQLSRCYVGTRHGTWDEDLQLLAGAIRAMKNRSTGYSANMMMLLMEVTQPVDILMGTEGAEMRDENPSAYLTRLCKTLEEVHQLARENLRSHLCYQKRTYDLKLQQNHYEVGDLVYRLNQVTKKGECQKLKPIWVGPLIVTEVITPVLFRVRGRKREQILHHDKLKICEDRAIPMWVRRLRHQILDLDTTIAYDEAEQEEDIGVQMVPQEERSTESLGLDKLFKGTEGEDSGAGQTQGAEDSQDLLADEESVESTRGESQDLLADEESAGLTMGTLADEESAGNHGSGSFSRTEPIEGGISLESRTVDEQSTGTADSVLADGQSADAEPLQTMSPVRMTRRGRAIKPPAHLRDYKL